MTRGRVLLTLNMQKDRPLEVARSGLATALVHKPDIAGLQEWPRSRDRILRELTGYSFARPAEGGGPVLFTDRYDLLHCRAVVLARSGFMGRLGGRRSSLPDSIANLTVLHDDATGDDVACINVHLTAEVQSRGRYRLDPAHLLRVARHRRERRRLMRLVRRQQAKGRVVYVFGDTNYDGMTLPPLKSCWDGRDGHTLGKRAVDVIFAETYADHVRTIETGSDHRAVVATHKES